MAIGDDFAIDYVNLRIYHNTGTTVYSVNALYSWLMDTFDELIQMDDTVPMSAATPTNYSMINGWFIDDTSVKYLNGGAIATLGWTDVIQVVTMQAGGYVSCIASDIGKTVHNAGETDYGELLFYNNTTRKWWVRNTAQLPTATAYHVHSGTGQGTSSSASATGEDLYANVYTLGTIESTPYPQIYIYQDGSDITAWWGRGHIDVLIKVLESDVEIALGVITVYAREYGDLYDNFEIDLTDGGRNPVPLATQADINNTRGTHYLLYDARTGAFAVNLIVTGGTSGAKAEIISVTHWGGGAVSGILELGNVKVGSGGLFQDNETITDTGTGSATVNGTLGDTYGTWDAEVASPIPGDLGKILTGGTSTAKRILRGYQDDGTSGKFVCQVSTTATGTARKPYYMTFEDNEAISATGDGGTMDVTSSSDSTTIVSGFTDITIAFVNGTANHGGTTGTFIGGERVTFSGGGEGILLYDSGSQVTLGNVTDTTINGDTITGDLSGATCVASQDLQSAHYLAKAFPTQSSHDYDVIVECGDIYHDEATDGRLIEDVYEYFKYVVQEKSSFDMYTVVSGTITILDGEEYIIAYTGYVPKKQSPLGTFAGGILFAAQSVWLEGMHTTDSQSFSLIDRLGATVDPPNYQSITVDKLVAGDRVLVVRAVGTDITKTLYASAAGNTAGDSDWVTETGGGITSDTPMSGVLRLVDNTNNTEHRMRYASWSGSTFTLLTKITATTDGVGTAILLIDSGTDFTLLDIKTGDICRNATTGGWAQVVSTANGSVTTTPLSTGIWGNGDTYEFHTLPVTYTQTTDTGYPPYIDEQATATSCVVTPIYVADRDVLIRVRKKGIVPFQTTGTYGSAGLTVSAIRQTDTIVT